MSTAHRPTWNPKRGGGGLRDGATAPPTLQNSAKDQVSHSHLKYRQPANQETDAFAEFFGTETEQIEYKEELDIKDIHEQDEQFITDIQGSDGVTDHSGQESDSDDEAALLAELEKIRAERAAMKASEKQSNNPQQPQRNTQEGIFVSRGWEEEGIVFRKRTNRNQSQSKPTEFINDTVRSGYHQDFINRYVK